MKKPLFILFFLMFAAETQRRAGFGNEPNRI
jgi:hypothetical protein